MKTLDQKLGRLHADPGAAGAFILADAKDADMAYGLAATGPDPATGRRRSLADYRDQIREIVEQGLVDIMLMSLSTSELLTVEEGLFEGSGVTPAVRANDTTDIHMLAGATYTQQPSRPFRTPSVRQIRESGARVLPRISRRGRAGGSSALPGGVRTQRSRRRRPQIRGRF